MAGGDLGVAALVYIVVVRGFIEADADHGLAWPILGALPLFVLGMWLLTVTRSLIAVLIALAATAILVGSAYETFLFRNIEGTFEDITRQSGLIQSDDPHWHASAAWADYDSDGLLDLAVCRYVSWFPDTERPCFDDRGRPIYCAPTAYAGDRSVLYRNLGNGRFRDVSAIAGFDAAVEVDPNCAMDTVSAAPA